MKKIYLSLVAITCLIDSANALSVQDVVKNTLDSNHEVISNKLTVDASQKDIDIAKGSYRPTVDFATTLEKSRQQINRKNTPKENWKNIGGYISTLSAEQLLYDGGKTSSNIDEKVFNTKSVSYKSTYKNQNIILDVIKSYNKLVEHEVLTQIYNYNLESHNEAYQIASEQEQISGSKLERKKTQSLISELKDKKLLQDLQANQDRLKLNRLTHVPIKDINHLCRPNINETILPKTQEEAIQIALQNNKQILEQKEIINSQKEKLGIQDADYLPTIKARLEGKYDDDIDLEEDGTKKSVTGQVSLNWNFYSGGSDDAEIEKEKINFMIEQKNLENLTEKTTEVVKDLYKRFSDTKKRIKIISDSLVTDQDILDITRSQLEDGTKTFSDELEAKSKVLETQSNIATLETELQDIYFEFLFQLGSLDTTILNSKNQMCTNTIVPNLIKKDTKVQEDLNLLLDEKAISETNLEANADKETLAQKLQKIYKNDYKYDPETMTATLLVSLNSFTLKKVNEKDLFYSNLEAISDKLLDLISKESNKINKVIITGHTSSEYRKYTDKNKMYIANKGLSQRRANKVLNYFQNKAQQKYGSASIVNNKFEAIGNSSDNVILNNNGTENKIASRRITIQVVPK